MHRGWKQRIVNIVWPWGVSIVALGVVGVLVLLAANGVGSEVTVEDRRIIAELDVDDECKPVTDYDGEIGCVKAVQEAIIERYPDTSDAFLRGETDHEIADYAERGYGSCYDRATFIETALRHYGFEVRRVAIYERQSLPFRYMQPGIRSHAFSEVRTSRGWLVVESIDPFLGLDDDEQPHSTGEIRQGLGTGEYDDETFTDAIPEDFFGGDFVYVYGVYSRHGYFFEPHLPVPEVDWSAFWSNFGR